MKNQTAALYKKTVKMAVITTFFLCPALAEADSCPVAKEAMDHALREGIGAQWQTGDKLKWYLDYFSNNNKPPETAGGKFTFMQASFENQQLTCYYQWPADDGKTTNWMTVRLRTTDKIKPNWTGVVCQNFEAINCQFAFENGAPGIGAAPATTPSATPGGAVQPNSTAAPTSTQTPPPAGTQVPPPTGTQTPPPAGTQQTLPPAPTPGSEEMPKAPGDLVLPPNS